MTALAPGHVLGDRFQLIRPLGKGGMGEVWLVEDRELADRVVAKVVAREATEDQLVLLRRECRHARKLVHANIVPVYEFHRSGDVCFITLAYVDGTPIASLRGRRLSAILPPLIAIADALDYAHRQGVVHRDLKASNVLIDASGEPHLLDFGIAGRIARREDGVDVRGGGTEGAASPEQLAGEAPSPADDIFALGMLARDLLSGQHLPMKLDALLTATANRDPRHRPRTMLDVKRGLEEARDELSTAPEKSVKLTPPPRVQTIEPVAPSGPPPSGASRRSLGSVARRAPRDGGLGVRTLLAFAALLALAVGVFFVLPRWVKKSGATVTPPSISEDSAPPAAPRHEAPAAELPDFADLARAKARVEDVRGGVVALRQSLDATGAGLWGGEAYQQAVRAITAGDEQLGRRGFAAAEASYESARRRLETVRERSSAVFSDALQRGRSALASGSSTEAKDAFALAARIRPGHAEASRGLERAKVLDELRRELARAEAAERRGDLKGAAARYQKAVALDPYSDAAQKGLARVDARASELAFTRAMSDAVAALNRRDFEAARESFERARAIRPEAPDVADGLEAVEEGIKLRTIAEHREKAAELERREAWRAAAAHYQAVLDVDATIRFAQEGKARTEGRAELSERLEFHIANPDRLSADAVLAEASRALHAASALSSPGPELQQQIARLTDLVAEYATPVQVYLLSDGETEVVVYKVGTLGKFDRHELVLRPGTYTVVGRRQGYRDVRHRLVVRAGNPPEPLVVRCEEEI